MGSRRALPRGVAAIALLASGGLLLVGCADDGSPLTANDWVLAEAENGGVPVEVGPWREIRWTFLEEGGCENVSPDCPEGPKVVGTDACNFFTRDVRVRFDEVVWGDYWLSTLVGCSGGLADTMQEFFWADSFRFTIGDEQLLLTSSNGLVDLTFRAADPESH